MEALTSDDIAPTCPYKDPIPIIGAAAEVAHTASADQHMGPFEGMDKT
jgi:hypothetical protein